jgi:hypothetical protein
LERKFQRQEMPKDTSVLTTRMRQFSDQKLAMARYRRKIATENLPFATAFLVAYLATEISVATGALICYFLNFYFECRVITTDWAVAKSRRTQSSPRGPSSIVFLFFLYSTRVATEWAIGN